MDVSFIPECHICLMLDVYAFLSLNISLCKKIYVVLSMLWMINIGGIAWFNSIGYGYIMVEENI